MKPTSRLICASLALVSAVGAGTRVSAADAAVPPPSRPASTVSATPDESLWSHDNLFAWCASVPFDARNRNSEERAAMLQKLGFTKFAYNWRGPSVANFDAEIEAMQRHHIEIIAWWLGGGSLGDKTKALEAGKRHNIHPQMWCMFNEPAKVTPEQAAQNVEKMANMFKSLDNMCRAYGCPVEIYNHDGWGGNEDNELAVLAHLKEMGITNIGLVYNFSHAHDADHDDTQGFPALWSRLKPYVVAVNITGMRPHWQGMIYPGRGTQELAMMKTIQDSGWRGPVGLVAEKGGDAEITLTNYLMGLDWLARQLRGPAAVSSPPAYIPQ